MNELENINVEYPIMGPYMDTSVPEVALNPGSLGYLAGVDPRFKGGLVSFPGLAFLKDIGTTSVITHFRIVCFAKKDSTSVYWGYLYCAGGTSLNLTITTDGANYTNSVVYSEGVVNSSMIDCYVNKDTLYVAMRGSAVKACFYSSLASTFLVVDMGPGTTFGSSDLMTKPVLGALGSSTEQYLVQGATYQAAYRFYSSERGIYSALSQPTTISVPKGETGDRTSADFTLPADVIAYQPEYSFDTVEWFRTIPLAGGGAIFYMERSDALSLSGTYTLGVIHDEALVLRDSYDPLSDTVKPAPQGGALGFYEGYMFVSHPTTDRGGYDISHSDITKDSVEYFTAFNEREGNTEEGRPLRFVRAGDYMLVMCENAVLHVSKIGTQKTLQYRTIHFNRGLVNPKAVHAAGSAVFFVCPIGLVMLDANTGDMNQVSAADGIILERWIGDMAVLEMGYDTDMNATFIFNPTKQEALMLGHTVQGIMMLENLPFAHMAEGLDATAHTKQKVFFIANNGRICYPDASKTPSGNMGGFSSTSYQLSGTGDIAGAVLTADAGITLQAGTTWEGARLYITSGTNAGEWRTIDYATASTITVTSAFGANDTGVTFAVAPVVFKARFWSIASHMQKVFKQSSFMRYKLNALAVKVVKPSYTGTCKSNTWLTGAYRNGSDTLSDVAYDLVVQDNPAESVVSKKVDGTDIEPFICQIGSKIKFKLISICSSVTVTNSRKIKKS